MINAVFKEITAHFHIVFSGNDTGANQGVGVDISTAHDLPCTVFNNSYVASRKAV